MDNTFYMTLSDDAVRMAKQREAATPDPVRAGPTRQESLIAAFHRARDGQDGDVLLEIARGRPYAFDECFMMPGLGYSGPDYNYVALKQDGDMTTDQVRKILHDGQGWVDSVYDLRQTFTSAQGAKPSPLAGTADLLPPKFAAGLREIKYESYYPGLTLWQKLSHLNQGRKEAYKQSLPLL